MAVLISKEGVEETRFDRWKVALWGTAGMLLAASFLGVLLSRDKTWLTFFDNLHWTVAYSSAAVMAWVGVRSATGDLRAPRRWFALGLSAYALGQVLWDIQVAIGNNPFPAPSDFFFLWLGTCNLIGLTVALRRSMNRSELRIVALDAVSLSVAVLMVTLALYLPRRGGTGFWPLTVMVAYPVGLLTAACVGALMVPTLRLRPEPGWIIFLVSLVFNGGLWMHWNVLTLDNTLGNGTLFNGCFSAAALANGVGAMQWRAVPHQNPVWERRCEWVLRLLPVLVVIGASVGVVLVLSIPGTLPAVKYTTLAGAFVVAGTALGRQSLLLRERDQLLIAERRVREHQLHYKALFETAQDAILILRGDWVEDGNPSALELFGCTRSALVGASLPDFAPEIQADRVRSRESLARHTTEALAGVPQCFEWIIRRRDGRELHAEVRLSLLERIDGTCLQAVMRDVTARKQAEEALRQRMEIEARFTKLARNIPGVLFAFRMSKEGVISVPYISPKAERLVDLRADNLAQDGEVLLSRIQRDDAPRVRAAILKSAETLENWHCVFRATMGTREGVWIEGRAVPEREKDGGTLWHGILFDVSQRRKAELDLERHRKELQLILDSVPALIFYKDRDHRILRLNAEAVRVTGMPREQVEGFTDRELHRTQADGYFRDEDEVMATGVSKRGIVEQLQTAGGTRWMLTDKLPYRDEKGNIVGIIGFSLDITERKNAETEREKLEAELRQSQKMEAIGQLAGGVAHDFNNILAVVHCNASFLLEGAHDAQSSALARQILDAVERAAKMIRQLLLVGRRQVMDPVDLDVGEVVTAMASLLQPLVGKAIVMSIQVEPNLPRAHADASMIEQVLLNLAVNARDAMPLGGRLKVEVDSIRIPPNQPSPSPDSRPGDFVRLSVLDEGSGIADEHLPRIFEPFFTTKEPGKGTGLGLSTVYGIIRQHQGWIEVARGATKGTVFRVYLPVSAAVGPFRTAVAAPEKRRVGQGTVLLVEDESALRALAKTILERAGYQVKEAADGPSALQVWREHADQIDLLFTDLVMPNGVSGRELARRLRAERPQLPVLFTSGYSQELASEEPTVGKREPFLPKPYSPSQLTEAVNACLSSA